MKKLNIRQIMDANPEFFNDKNCNQFGDRGYSLDGYFLTIKVMPGFSHDPNGVYDAEYIVHHKTLKLYTPFKDGKKTYYFVEVENVVRKQFVNNLGEPEGDPV